MEKENSKRLIIITLILTILSIKECTAQFYAPFNGIGPTETNIFTFRQNATKYSYSYFVSRDATTQLTCIVLEDYPRQALSCLTDQGEITYQFSYISYNWINSIPIIYDTKSKSLIFNQEIINEERISKYYISSFNTATGTLNYNHTIGGDEERNELYEEPWNINEESGVFYTFNQNDDKMINVFNISTGLFIHSVSSPVGIEFAIVSNNTLLVSSEDTCNDHYHFDCTFMLYILAPISLTPLCTFNNSLVAIYSDTRYYYVINDGDDFNNPYSYSLFQYDMQCNPLWRFPLPYYDNYLVLSYDLNYDWLYLYDKSNFTRMNVFDVTDYKQFDPEGGFLGADLNSNLYFWSYGVDQLSFSLVSYDSSFQKYLDLSLYPLTQSELSSGLFISFNSWPIGLTTNGVLFFTETFGDDVIEPKYIVAFQTASSFNWELLSIISLIVLILSFLVSIVLMIKHKVMGGDPKGWHKRKLLDLLGIFLTSIALIVVTFAVCNAQIGLVNLVNENTTMFSLSFEEFVDEYVESCSTPSLPLPSAVDLCTCYMSTSIPFRNSSCIEGACSNENYYYCEWLLEGSCDCHDSLYQWSCACDYNIDGTCSANVTSSLTLNPTASNAWEQCRRSFDVPTDVLNISFYTSIVCAAILLFLNFLQILGKFDFPLLDFAITILSIIFATLQFALLVYGNSFLESGCIEGVIDTLPGCALIYSATSNVLTMESNALAYLSNAYLNLVSSPIMFIITALPDLLSLFVCIKSEKSEHLEALRNCFRCFFRRGFEKI